MITDDACASTDEDNAPDEYDSLLASINRSYDEDCRIAIHESGHVLAALLLGEPVGFVTVTPADGYEGCVRGTWGVRAFVKEGGKVVDASDVRAVLAPSMPQPGEDRAKVSDIFSSVHAKCIEYAAGRVAEMLCDGEASPGVDDRRQMRELAALFCSSEKAIDSFLTHCEIAAHDLLSPYAPLIWSFSIVLRIRRVMTGAEVSEAVATILAEFDRAREQRRRTDWKRIEQSAAAFVAKFKPE